MGFSPLHVQLLAAKLGSLPRVGNSAWELALGKVWRSPGYFANMQPDAETARRAAEDVQGKSIRDPLEVPGEKRGFISLDVSSKP